MRVEDVYADIVRLALRPSCEQARWIFPAVASGVIGSTGAADVPTRVAVTVVHGASCAIQDECSRCGAYVAAERGRKSAVIVRLAAAVLYAALVGAVFIGYYVDVRDAPPSTLVDYTPAVLYLAMASLLLGILSGRWWAIPMPLIAFLMAAVLVVIGTLDDRYSKVAPDRGGVVGLDWFGVAALFCVYAVPAAAFGVGLRALGGHWEQKWLARQRAAGRQHRVERVRRG